jgi:hypothetical protein
MLLKKTIVHPPGIKVHPSTPLLLLINYRKVLISLDYRTKDDFYDCIDSYTEYFDEFLPAIHSLRNSFIHGFRTNLAPDGARYRITKQDIKVKNTGNLELDVFTGEININTLNFVRDLLICLTKMVKNSKTVIPV